jgi:3-hydroxybutyryl-CoA dehydratase
MEEYTGYYLEDLKEGMTAVFGKTVTDADICIFAGVSGDTNPVHLNDDYASKTMFKGRIAHGMFGAGLISAVLGTKLPGPGCIYVSQTLKFKAPVKAGDTLVARATVKSINTDKKLVELDTVCTVGEKVVIQGEAMVMVPKKG